jgi:SAM-dependent methyltransferase
MKAEAFFDTYVQPIIQDGKKVRILDIGSKSYENQRSYADIFRVDNIEYVGLDLEEGKNVNLVPENSFIWNEIEKESFDFCISGQTFEHNPFFWITFAEVARVLKQDGKVIIIAPGRGDVHRFPVDCWRFYPDSWQALCTYTGLSVVESLFEDYDFNQLEKGANWCDSTLIASKPSLNNTNEEAIFYESLLKINSTLPVNSNDAIKTKDIPLVALKNYKTLTSKPFIQSLLKRLFHKNIKKRVFHYWP